MPFGGAIKLTGESEYVRALTQINGKLKETSADMKLVSASFSSNDKSVQATAQKTEVLTRKLNEQKEKLSLLKSEYAKMQGTYSEQKSKHEQLVQEYQKEEKELERIAKESGTTSKAYQDQKKKVDALAKDVEKSTKADIANEKAMSKMRAEITKTEAEVKKTSRQIDDLGKETKQTASETKDAGDGFTVFKGILSNLATDALRRVIDGLKQLAKAAYEAWKEFDKGADIIIAKTGDTGQGIMDVYGKVAGQVPAELEEIGSAVGQVSTRFDLQGEALEDVTTQFLKFAKVNQTDVEGSIDSVQSMMAAWNIRTKDTTRVLSVLTSASQKTGINVDTLSDLMVTNAAAIQELGLGYEDAAFFVGEFSKSGLDTSQTMMGLKKALQAATKEGKPLNQFLAEAEKNIKGAKTEQEALTIATNTFGTKAGPNLAKALRNGNISFKDFEKGVKASDKALDDTFENMLSFPDKTKMLTNDLKTLVGGFFDSVINGDADEFVNTTLPEKMHEIISGENGINSLMEDLSEAIANGYGPLKDGFTIAINTALKELDTKAIGKAFATFLMESSLDGEEDLDKGALGGFIGNFFDGIIEAFEEYEVDPEKRARVRETFLNKINEWLVGGLDVLSGVPTVGVSSPFGLFADAWWGNVLKTLAESGPGPAADFARQILDLIGYRLGEGADRAIDVGQALIDYIFGNNGEYGPSLSKHIDMLFDAIEEYILTKIAELLGLGEEATQEFIDGMMGKEVDAEKAGKDIGKSAEKGLSTGKKGAKKQGADTSANYASGISSGKGKAGSSATGVSDLVAANLKPAANTAYSTGYAVSAGIAQGIESGRSTIMAVVNSIAADITQAFKDAQKIHSPSKVMEQEVGLPMAQGVAVGFEDGMKELTGQMAETIPTTFGVSTSTRSASRQAREQANMVTAFKQALSDVKIVLNNKVAGQFVETTVSRLIYS